MKRENEGDGSQPGDGNGHNDQDDQDNADNDQENSPESRAKRIKLDGNQEIRLLIPSKVNTTPILCSKSLLTSKILLKIQFITIFSSLELSLGKVVKIFKNCAPR